MGTSDVKYMAPTERSHLLFYLCKSNVLLWHVELSNIVCEPGLDPRRPDICHDNLQLGHNHF